MIYCVRLDQKWTQGDSHLRLIVRFSAILSWVNLVFSIKSEPSTVSISIYYISIFQDPSYCWLALLAKNFMVTNKMYAITEQERLKWEKVSSIDVKNIC